MGARARVVRLPHIDHDYVPSSSAVEQVERLCAEIVAALERRSACGSEVFAERVQNLSPRQPGLTGAAVRAAKSGTHPLDFDLVGVGMIAAGLPAIRILSDVLVAVVS